MDYKRRIAENWCKYPHVIIWGMVLSDSIKATLDSLPAKPGCYLMRDGEGKIIYVGKAINLRNRVRSYFHESAQMERKTRELVKRIVEIEFIVVGSELESLILEMNLIKKHRPRYNVRLKDDRRFPYIKVHWADPFPKVTVTRNMVKDGNRYFGPYTSVWAVHKTLDVLRRIFPYLTCDRVISGADQRACLYFDIKLCNAPCIGAVDQLAYRTVISDLCDFLEGRTEGVVNRLEAAMADASSEMKYEQAAAIRDQLIAIENVVEKQKVVSAGYVDSDVIALARDDREACIQVFFIRSGKLIGREYFMMEGVDDSRDPAILAEFVKQFYDQAATVPQELLLPIDIEEVNIIRSWLEHRGDHKVEIKIPQRGQKRELVEMATENAQETLGALQAQWEADRHAQSVSLAELQLALELPKPPIRIECYDISNTQGTAAVGSMVVFENGVPEKKHYRRFNIRSVEGPDDFASMEEVLSRRFGQWQAALESPDLPGKKKDASFSRLPDLLIVDGGRGQLGRAATVMESFGLLGQIKLIGLAKQNEEVFTLDRSEGILLPRKSPALYLLQRIRDEAHRFAITAHRQRRSRLGLVSTLDSIPGVGPTIRKKLLTHFGSIEAIRSASETELLAVRGINRRTVQAIRNHLD